MFWLALLAIIIGYLIGSISPSYILGRLMKGVDIRKHGDKNAGATNAFKVLGVRAGITTLLFDLVKGVLAMFIASLLGLTLPIICLTGFAAILGHDFPFYLQFKGGRGSATSGGIMIFLLFLLLRPYFHLPLTQIPGAIPLLIIAFFVIAIFLITGSLTLAFFTFYLALIVSTLIFNFSPITIALVFFAAYSLLISLIDILVTGGLKKNLKFAKRKAKIKLYRKAIRFAALIFPILYFWFSKTIIIWLIVAFLVLFLVLDFARKTKLGKLLYKKGEAKVSGFTLFLIAALFTVLIFGKEIAILALVFAAIGDNMAVLIGIPFGKKKLIGKKTLEGAVACLASCFLAGLIVMAFLEVPLLIVILGAFAATLTELFSGYYDNLTIAPFAAAVMSVLVALV